MRPHRLFLIHALRSPLKIPPTAHLARRNFSYRDANALGPARIADISAKSGVSRFVHVSHLNAAADSPSKFYQAKAEGEVLVKDAFPAATIVRPASMFGYEDKLLNNIAGARARSARRSLRDLLTDAPPSPPSLAYLVEAESRADQDPPRPRNFFLRPPSNRRRCLMTIPNAQVMDVAQALANLISVPALSRTLALPGPSTLTFEYLLELVSTMTYNPPSRAPVLPQRVALALARAAQAVWWPALSPDEVARRFIDDVDAPGDWDAVGVVPDEIENHAITYVRRYRSA